jgi:GNAT superfamily N-acetyltransferase
VPETQRCERRIMRTASTCRPVRSTVEPLVPRRSEDRELGALVRQPWTLRVGRTSLLVRPSGLRDLAAVARMHSRCSPRSLLDRYRAGGRQPAVAALDAALRSPNGVVAATAEGDIVAVASLTRDRGHSHFCAEIGLLVEDEWQRLGIGSELISHMAGVASVAGFHELIAYPATAMTAVQRLMIEVGRTRIVPDVDVHLHTYLPDSAALGLGSVRQRLAG